MSVKYLRHKERTMDFRLTQSPLTSFFIVANAYAKEEQNKDYKG